MIDFFISIKPVMVVIHALGAAVGLGAVVVTDALFFSFLKNFKISPKEDSVLRTVSLVIWGAIGVLLITGIGLYLSGPLDYLAKSKFLIKVIVFVIIVINGVLLNWILTPFLKKIAFGPIFTTPSLKIRLLRRLAFASGALSITSWLVVFLLGSVRSIPLTIGQGLVGYALLAGTAILGSQIYASWLRHKKTKLF